MVKDKSISLSFKFHDISKSSKARIARMTHFSNTLDMVVIMYINYVTFLHNGNKKNMLVTDMLMLLLIFITGY